jgi:hypothetical protein
MNEVINQERFEAWLFSQPLDRVIEAANTDKCFLCSFLKETANVKTTHMTYETWHVDGRAGCLPSWATKLINPKTLNEWGTMFDLRPISVGSMQELYLELFPKTMTVEGEPQPHKQTKTVTMPVNPQWTTTSNMPAQKVTKFLASTLG